MTMRYNTRGADTFVAHSPKRCPVCDFPMGNGFQLVCEPGVCMFHEKPIHYGSRTKRKAA